MKRIIETFLIIVSVMLRACSFGGDTVIMDDDLTVARTKMEETLKAIQSDDKEEIICLFSKDVCEKSQEMNECAEALLAYFNGQVNSYDEYGPAVENSKEDDVIVQLIDFSCDVKTTECEYQIAIRYVAKDTSNTDNVGLQSLYIIKRQDSIQPECAYWGDGKFTPGIHIGIQ